MIGSKPIALPLGYAPKYFVALLLLVPKVGLEPTLLSKLDFESSASTSFTTRAIRVALHHVAILHH